MKEQKVNGFIMESWKSEDLPSAHRRFLIRANSLVHRLIDADLPAEIEESILSGKPSFYKLGDVDIELICRNRSEEDRLGMMLIVRRPGSAPASFEK